jgi:hypothetical protein
MQVQLELQAKLERKDNKVKQVLLVLKVDMVLKAQPEKEVQLGLMVKQEFQVIKEIQEWLVPRVQMVSLE